MTTTSLKLPEDLKLRVASIAMTLGMTPQAFMVDAIRKAAVAAEKHAHFVEQAKIARKKMLATGMDFDADEVHAHLRQRVNAAQSSGEQASKASKTATSIVAPKAKQWRG